MRSARLLWFLGPVAVLAFLALALYLTVGWDSREESESPAESDPVTPAEVVQQDINRDGIEETILVYEQDGIPTRAEADTNQDGKVDLWVRYEGLDEIGEMAYDRDGDGRPEEWQLFEDGVLTARHQDTTGDGSPDLWTLNDEEGAVLEMHRDADADGRPDLWSSYYPDASLRRVAYDTNSDGRPDLWINYGVEGEVASIETDTDGDGTPDQFTVPSEQQ